MPSATLKTPLLLPPPPSYRSEFTYRNSFFRVQLKPELPNRFKSLKCIRSSNSNINSLSSSVASFEEARAGRVSVAAAIDDRIQSLVSEFESLTEPTDRVRRLLHYADLLPPFQESRRVEASRVRGCTAQVWLESRLEEEGEGEAGGRNWVMRFGADSDSEITKGFCYCLVWMLDGAAPEEVLGLKAEDLAELNVGLQSRTHSRVNAWYNVLISMQKRTRILVEERGSERLSEPLSAMIVAADDSTAKGSNSSVEQQIPWRSLAVKKVLLDEFSDQILH